MQVAQCWLGSTKQFSTHPASVKVNPKSHNPGPSDYTILSSFPTQKHLRSNALSADGAGS